MGQMFCYPSDSAALASSGERTQGAVERPPPHVRRERSPPRATRRRPATGAARLSVVPTRARAQRNSVSTSTSEFASRRLTERGRVADALPRVSSSPSFAVQAVRPKFFNSQGETANGDRFAVSAFVAAQKKTLSQLAELEQELRFAEIHSLHFDWWLFPVEDGRRRGYNVLRDDALALRANAAWLAGYRTAVAVVARAWGWDAARAEPVPRRAPGQRWAFWDVRLAKMVRSTWLFEQHDLLDSLQRFARTIHPHGGFRYGAINLDEILYLTPDSEPRMRPHAPSDAADAHAASAAEDAASAADGDPAYAADDDAPNPRPAEADSVLQ